VPLLRTLRPKSACWVLRACLLCSILCLDLWHDAPHALPLFSIRRSGRLTTQLSRDVPVYMHLPVQTSDLAGRQQTAGTGMVQETDGVSSCNKTVFSWVKKS
jgi:hypothetical protein